jgi:hypothetical protein
MNGGSWDDDDGIYDDDEVDPYGGDDLAALDFSPPGRDSAVDAGGEADDPVFTVTNPAGTVSVTAYFTGPIQRVDLGADAAGMTESQLAEEIRVVAELAQLKARSVVHAFLLDGMTKMGHDRAAMTSTLSRAVGLPSPEQADEKIAAVFSARYGDDEY